MICSVAQERVRLELFLAKLTTRIACMQANEARSIVLLHLDCRCNQQKPEPQEIRMDQYRML
jgi:hypothetical protein